MTASPAPPGKFGNEELKSATNMRNSSSSLEDSCFNSHLSVICLQFRHLLQLSRLLYPHHFCSFHQRFPDSQTNTGRTLEHVHGVHVVQHSPFELQEISQDGNFQQSTHGRLTIGVNQLLGVQTVQRVWQQRPLCLRPIHSCLHGDRHLGERIANILTSIPFIAVGIHAPRKNLNSKLYANSLIGVGIASGLYHSSRGRWRKYLRWADYTMIATATVCLSRALREENPKLLMAASALCLPIQPLMVSAVHTGMMEVAFARRAVKDPELKLMHNVHKMSALLGGAFFVADDLFPEIPYLHAGWHLAAAIGVGACNKLLE